MQKNKNTKNNNFNHTPELSHIDQESSALEQARWQKKVEKSLRNISTVLKHQPRSVVAVFSVLLMFAAVFGSVTLPDSSSAKPINERDPRAVVNCGYRSFLNREPEPDNPKTKELEGREFWEEYYVKNKYDSRKLGATLLKSKEGQFVAYTTSFDSFVRRMYKGCLGGKTATTKDVQAWTNAHLTGTSRQDIFNFIVQVGDKPDRIAALAPQEERCKQFNKGGSVVPLCRPGSAGTSNDVVVQPVPGTNIIVNKAWYNTMNTLIGKARSSGYNLTASSSLGSYRTQAQQESLRESNSNATKKVSMHQWGLAVDFRCNGRPIASHSDCIRWIRNEAPKLGINAKVYNPPEPWHWSTTGH